LPSLIQPSWGESGGRLLLLPHMGGSGPLGQSAALAHLTRRTQTLIEIQPDLALPPNRWLSAWPWDGEAPAASSKCQRERTAALNPLEPDSHEQ
jgi:hypothetical protein